MKVGIIGVGYVGLVTGVVLASKGNDVVCVDINEEVVAKLQNGVSHIYEPGLDSLLGSALHANKLCVFKNDVSHLINCEIIFVCVDTPTIKDKPDLTHLFQAVALAAEAVKFSDKFISIIIKNTVLPGITSRAVQQLIADVSGKIHNDFGIGSNPEFLREGNALDDFINADRIIIGAEDEITKNRLLELYSNWDCEKIISNSTTAEFAKYVNNSFWAMLISFGNEMSKIAMHDKNINLRTAIESIGSDKRITPSAEAIGKVNASILSYLVPGPGYGGSCLPKDIKAFLSYANTLGVDPYILQAIHNTNEKQPAEVISLIEKSIDNSYEKSYLVLGFSHKPNTNDSRHSSSIPIISKLISNGAKVILHDPVSLESAKDQFNCSKNISYTTNWLDELSNVEVIVLLTAWDNYRELAGHKHVKKLNNKFIVDTRYMFKKSSFENATYISF